MQRTLQAVQSQRRLSAQMGAASLTVLSVAPVPPVPPAPISGPRTIPGQTLVSTSRSPASSLMQQCHQVRPRLVVWALLAPLVLIGCLVVAPQARYEHSRQAAGPLPTVAVVPRDGRAPWTVAGLSLPFAIRPSAVPVLQSDSVTTTEPDRPSQANQTSRSDTSVWLTNPDIDVACPSSRPTAAVADTRSAPGTVVVTAMQDCSR